MLNSKEVTPVQQRAAQAAAWYFTDGMSWSELSSKVGAKHLNGMTSPSSRQQRFAWECSWPGKRCAVRMLNPSMMRKRIR